MAQSALKKYSELALQRLKTGELSEVVWLPAEVRGAKRLGPEGATTTLPSIDEQFDRITAADPVGFLVAIMNGQPILTFRIAKSTDPEYGKPSKRRGMTMPIDHEVVAEYHVPTLTDRKQVALDLAEFTLRRSSKPGPKSKDAPPAPLDEFAAIVENAANRLEEE